MQKPIKHQSTSVRIADCTLLCLSMEIGEGPKGRPEGGEWEPIQNSCKLKLRLSPNMHIQL